MGLSVAPALGQDIAEWVISGCRPPSLAGFAVSRFSQQAQTDGEVHRKSLAEYEGIYRDAESRIFVRA
jgi:hypothetical protein